MIPSQANSSSSFPQLDDTVHPFINTGLGSEIACDSSVASSPIATPGNEYKYTQSRSAPLSTALLKDLALLTDDVIHTSRLNDIRNKKGYIIDMDGVIYHGSTLLPGAKEFVQFLHDNNKEFLFLTNNSAPTPRELKQKLGRLGIDVDESRFYTAALATAQFLSTQMPEGGSCYVIGEPGLTFALYSKGFYMNDVNPDYVVLGEGPSYDYEKMCKAVSLVMKGAKLIATNLDVETLNSKGEVIPSCGAFTAAIELVTKTKAFFCGKPSALIMRYAQRSLGIDHEDTCIIGDRMDTDIVAGVTSQIDPVLVLSGVTKMEDLRNFTYRPYVILGGVYEIPTNNSEQN
ncbi:hypothetical protein INT44_005858 [Umbelopsis vinacea]|uniref:4-nitrophenylphosphatase n=1 Tax=Umbelopsis vinacea TaxID=44442 RepID=A0A8H7PYR2_9FUNG|nr:hypothetical protein INT44_005858 [Umbelopsis vinacea]